MGLLAAWLLWVCLPPHRCAGETHPRNALPAALSRPLTVRIESRLHQAIAEACACVIRVPAELVKLKRQSHQAESLGGALRAAWSHGGLSGLYRGLGATLCLDIPFAQLQMPLYEHLRRSITLRRNGEGSAPQPLDGALAGAVAGATAAFFTTPLDVIRTRHVLWPLREGERRPLSLTVSTILENEGAMGFWRGVLPRTIYMGLGGTLYLGTYSYCSAVLVKFAGHEPPSRMRV